MRASEEEVCAFVERLTERYEQRGGEQAAPAARSAATCLADLGDGARERFGRVADGFLAVVERDRDGREDPAGAYWQNEPMSVRDALVAALLSGDGDRNPRWVRGAPGYRRGHGHARGARRTRRPLPRRRDGRWRGGCGRSPRRRSRNAEPSRRPTGTAR